MHAEFTFDDHMRDLPAVEGDTVQLGRGGATFLSERVGGKDAILVRLRVEPRLVGSVVPDPEWLAILVPLRWRGKFLCNGEAYRPYDTFVSSGPNGYVTVGENRDTVVMGIRKARLQAACAALQGVPPEAVDFADLHLSLGPTTGSLLQRRTTRLTALSSEDVRDGGQARLGAVIESDLVTTIAALLTRHQFGGRCSTPTRLNALKIVRTASQTADADPLRPPSLADLCAATGVGQTWLHKAFVDILGVSPMKFMRARRLTQARNMFRNPMQPAPSVKYAARSMGFAESGRFARDYRAMFGENPSDTLGMRYEKGEPSDARSRGVEASKTNRKQTFTGIGSFQYSRTAAAMRRTST